MTGELKLQLALLNIRYSVDDINLYNINWDRLLIDSSNNRILYEITKQIFINNFAEVIDKKNSDKIEDIYRLGAKHIEKTKNSVKLIDHEMKTIGKDYLVCKTQKDFDFITYDVDCLFRENEYDAVMAHLMSKYVKEDCLKKKQMDIFVPKMLRLDMHYGFFWAGVDYIDNKIVWESKQIRNVFGVNVHTPDDTVEFILTILNLTFERLHVPLLEYAYIRKIIKNVDMTIVERMAKKNNWEIALKIITSKLDQINLYLFNETIFGNNIQKPKNIEMPMMFTWLEFVRLYSDFIVKRKRVPYYDIAYFIFAKSRFHLDGKKQVPIYGHGYKNLYKNSGAKY